MPLASPGPVAAQNSRRETASNHRRYAPRRIHNRHRANTGSALNRPGAPGRQTALGHLARRKDGEGNGAVQLPDNTSGRTDHPARPPAAIWIGHYTGASFPSGHATQSAAFYAMLAIVLGAGLPVRRRAILWSAAALVVLVVGASRIYLGAHWLTDVLAGYALGATWVAIVVAVLLTTSRGTSKSQSRARPGRVTGIGTTGNPPGHRSQVIGARGSGV